MTSVDPLSEAKAPKKITKMAGIKRPPSPPGSFIGNMGASKTPLSETPTPTPDPEATPTRSETPGESSEILEPGKPAIEMVESVSPKKNVVRMFDQQAKNLEAESHENGKPKVEEFTQQPEEP